jgi:hypothetical protein
MDRAIFLDAILLETRPGSRPFVFRIAPGQCCVTMAPVQLEGCNSESNGVQFSAEELIFSKR